VMASVSFCGTVPAPRILPVSIRNDDRRLLGVPCLPTLFSRDIEARSTHRTAWRSGLPYFTNFAVFSVFYPAPVTGYMFGKGVYFADVSWIPCKCTRSQLITQFGRWCRKSVYHLTIDSWQQLTGISPQTTAIQGVCAKTCWSQTAH
jgi:hypothetical protein